jgi:hypothetical protein
VAERLGDKDKTLHGLDRRRLLSFDLKLLLLLKLQLSLKLLCLEAGGGGGHGGPLTHHHRTNLHTTQRGERRRVRRGDRGERQKERVDG